MRPGIMTQVINRKKYSTATATLIASDDYWDGHNWERHGRNQFLYRAPKGGYFAVYLTQWEGEIDRIEALEQDEAIAMWEHLPEHEVTFEQAFPGVTVVEA